MYIVCSDLEGVYVPEIWINVALRTGIEELKLTTRDISDYDVLMNGRLSILKKHGLALQDIQKVISTLNPLPGAVEFLNWLRKETQLILVSDTFIEFAGPLIEKLGQPTLLCHQLTTNTTGIITEYNLRQKEAKKKVVEALHNLNYKVIAIGDSYNDIKMLREADHGILYNPPQNVIAEHGDLMIVNSYKDLKYSISQIIGQNSLY